jgi:hypothetical protein
MSNFIPNSHLHVAEIGDEVRSLAVSAAYDDIKTDAPECAEEVRRLEALGVHIATTLAEKPIILAFTRAAAGTIAYALRAQLTRTANEQDTGTLEALAILLEGEAVRPNAGALNAATPESA